VSYIITSFFILFNDRYASTYQRLKKKHRKDAKYISTTALWLKCGVLWCSTTALNQLCIIDQKSATNRPSCTKKKKINKNKKPTVNYNISRPVLWNKL
jgi:hypothetical protein